jgi:mono/diheme cytochrome c family protein
MRYLFSAVVRSLCLTRAGVLGFALCVMLGVVLGALGCAQFDDIPPAPPAQQISRTRGQQLVHGLAGCDFCHAGGGSLGGGRLMADRYGQVAAPNISPDPAGIGSWRDQDLVRLFRSHTRPDQRSISVAFHRGAEWLSESDLRSIVAYLRTLPASSQQVPAREISTLERNLVGFTEASPTVRGVVPAVSPEFKREYGAYLADAVARCGACHTYRGGFLESERYFAGGEVISFDGEEKVAPNITSSVREGIGSWSANALSTFLRRGVTPDGRRVDTRFCPVTAFSRATAGDLEALVTYLRTVPAVGADDGDDDDDESPAAALSAAAPAAAAHATPTPSKKRGAQP